MAIAVAGEVLTSEILSHGLVAVHAAYTVDLAAILAQGHDRHSEMFFYILCWCC